MGFLRALVPGDDNAILESDTVASGAVWLPLAHVTFHKHS
jgi:hypothetical protein